MIQFSISAWFGLAFAFGLLTMSLTMIVGTVSIRIAELIKGE